MTSPLSARRCWTAASTAARAAGERPGRAVTAETAWQAWGGLDSLPELVLPAAGRVVALAAHPDDETLGAGGTLQRLAGPGRRPHLVLATDLTRLGLPDREVPEHPDELVERLVPLLAGAAALLAPYRSDGHRDHDACLAAGGYGAAPGEDLALFRDVGAAGYRSVATTSIQVTTSARRDGRARGGLSDLLDRLSAGPSSEDAAG